MLLEIGIFSVKEKMLKMGCEQSKLGKSMLRWYKDGKLQGLS